MSTTDELIQKLKRISDPSEARAFICPRGYACISQGVLKKAEDSRIEAKSEREIVTNLRKKFPMLHKRNGKLYMVYPKCYCHHLKGYEGEVPCAYCYCSEAWVKHLFEVALNREVKVEIESSVLWGDEKCRIRVDM